MATRGPSPEIRSRFMRFDSTQRHRDAEGISRKIIPLKIRRFRGRGRLWVLSKKTLCLCASVLICALAFAQVKPHIDFDQLLREFPDLPWDFEIRYVVREGLNTDMLRIHSDARMDLVKWRPGDQGSLSEVCHSNLEEKPFRHLLETFREKKFNDLPSDDAPVRAIAEEGETTVSVRLGKTTVRKTDRHERENPGLAALESELSAIQTGLVADPKTTCGMETVPAKP